MTLLGFGTSLPERDWTLPLFRVALGEREWAGVGILVSHWLAACMLDFSLVSASVCSLCLCVRERMKTVVCAYVANN